jgi:hypothetical protein
MDDFVNAIGNYRRHVFKDHTSSRRNCSSNYGGAHYPASTVVLSCRGHSFAARTPLCALVLRFCSGLSVLRVRGYKLRVNGKRCPCLMPVNPIRVGLLYTAR